MKCENLITIDQRDILQMFGKLSDVLRVKLDECLKAGGSAKCLTLRLDGEEAAMW